MADSEELVLQKAHDELPFVCGAPFSTHAFATSSYLILSTVTLQQEIRGKKRSSEKFTPSGGRMHREK